MTGVINQNVEGNVTDEYGEPVNLWIMAPVICLHAFAAGHIVAGFLPTRNQLIAIGLAVLTLFSLFVIEGVYPPIFERGQDFFTANRITFFFIYNACFWVALALAWIRILNDRLHKVEQEILRLRYGIQSRNSNTTDVGTTRG